jgi:hypothetical protein
MHIITSVFCESMLVVKLLLVQSFKSNILYTLPRLHTHVIEENARIIRDSSLSHHANVCSVDCY